MNRREQARAATLDQIKGSARRQLAREGPAAISLRAIARDLGMTAPALYRYFPSLEALVAALVVDCFDEVRRATEAARDLVPPDDPLRRLGEVSRAYRRWALDHPAEFALLFGTPLPGRVDEPHEAGNRFGQTFRDIFLEIWRRKPFPVPDDDDLGPALRGQLAAHLDWYGDDVPLGAVFVFVSCWTRLYGMVAMEVFGHLHWAVDDVEPLFEAEMAALARSFGG